MIRTTKPNGVVEFTSDGGRALIQPCDGGGVSVSIVPAGVPIHWSTPPRFFSKQEFAEREAKKTLVRLLDPDTLSLYVSSVGREWGGQS